jgi:hypothetical protein
VRAVLIHIIPHKLAEYLGRWAVLLPADLNEALPQFPIDPYAKSRIFHHAGSVANGYTLEQAEVAVPRSFY